MKSLREMVENLAGRRLSGKIVRPRAIPRRFRPAAEAMEGRAMLSHAGLGAAIHAGSGTLDTVVVNGQVEVQPDDVVQASLPVRASTR
jgi:hypothetical protein